MAMIIQELDPKAKGGTTLRGAALQLWNYRGIEVMLAGPAETGKTIACLTKAHALCLKYPGTQGAIVRQTQTSVYSSVVPSFEKKILGPLYKTIVKPYGGEKPEWYDYPNGSRIWVGGLDNPDKVLSSERDFVYVNQTEEISLQAWQYLLTRTTGRAGNMPYSQVFGDANPGPPSHWIINRESMEVFYSKHEDNPILFDEQGKITEQGKTSMAILDSLTGVLKLRLRYGIWAGAEGTVYDNFDHRINLISRKKVPRCNRRLELVDFGFTNPFCWENWHIDDDDRVYVFQEIYHTQRIVEEHCVKINQQVAGQIAPEVIICDTDAEDRKTFEKYRGFKTKGASKLLLRDGIDLVRARLEKAADGKPRFFYVEDALVEVDQSLKDAFKPTCSKEEVDVYVWDEKKDKPIKEFDHGMDDWRYGVQYLDKGKVKRRTRGSLSFGTR